ncbi:MAG TPA: ABC transporter permease [Gemmatimonadaceae bacterium]|nr:ABC transporter permease [Gemmatimonadaceae bacterium]
MSWIHGLGDWLGSLVRHDARERELDEEIRFHLDMEAAKHRARGHDAETARRVAAERFGNVTRVRQATRDARGPVFPEGYVHDLRWAARSLRKQPGFTALALITLALGVGATTTAFTVLDTVLLRPLPYEGADRLVFMRERTAEGQLLPPSFPNFSDWRHQARSFSGVASTSFAPPATVVAGTGPVRATTMGVSRRFFAVLGVRPAVGREFTDAENASGGSDVVMVSHAFWRDQMGARRPLGTIRYGGTAVTVVGVLPPGIRFLDDADLYFPHERGPGTVRNAHNYRVIARLAPGATLASTRAEMSTISRALKAAYGEDTQAADVDVVPLRDFLVGDYRLMLIVVFGAAAMVLLIACTNLVSAQLARGLARQREVAVRAALGASRARLVRLLFIETGLLVVAGSSLGALVAVMLTRVVRALGAGQVPRLDELSVNGGVVAFVTAVAVTTALLAGLYPALRLAGGAPGDALRASRGEGTMVRRSVWRILIGFEVATAVVLLVGSALLIRTLHNILTADTGFDPNAVVTAAMAPRGLTPEQVTRIRDEFAALPGVTGAAFTSHLPFAWGDMSAPVRRPGDPVDRDWIAMGGFRVVTPSYFAVLRQPMVRGRAFTEQDRAGAPLVAIVTPGIAEKLWPGQDPIGKTVGTNYMVDVWMTVVGVVGEASSWTMPRGTQNEIFVPYAQQPDAEPARSQLVATLRTSGDPAALIPVIRARLRELAPDTPARFSTLEERISRSAADRRFAMFALTAFGVIALVLASIGIYGVVSYTVVTRTREIGIRMALGAAPSVVRSEVLRGAASMALGGIAVGTIAGLFVTKYLESSLYGISRRDPLAYVVGGVVLLAAALLGAYVPARRSSRVDPLLAIRGD